MCFDLSKSKVQHEYNEGGFSLSTSSLVSYSKHFHPGRVIPVKQGTAAVQDTDSLFHVVGQVRNASSSSRDEVIQGPDLPQDCKLSVSLKQNGFIQPGLSNSEQHPSNQSIQ